MILRNHFIKVGNVRDINIYPVGDLQFGSDGFADALWKEWTEKVRRDPNALIIGMGDYSDHWRPTNQARLAGAMTGDPEFQASMDEMYQAHNQKIFEKLAPLLKAGRCLGLLSGHHEFTYSYGINSTQELCQKLNVPYLGRMAFLRLIIQDGKKQNTWTLKIHAQHGEGGAATISADVRNLEARTAPFWNADLILRGHSTKVYAFAIPQMDLTDHRGQDEPRLIEKKVTCVNTGGFMKGYLPGTQQNARETYVSKKNLPPAHLGYAVVHLHLARHRDTTNFRSRQVDITVTH